MSRKNLPAIRKATAIVAKTTKRKKSKRITTKEPHAPQRTNEAAKETFDQCVRDLQKIRSLLIPIQYAALYDVAFDMSDALTIVIDRAGVLLDTLDQLETVI